MAQAYAAGRYVDAHQSGAQARYGLHRVFRCRENQAAVPIRIRSPPRYGFSSSAESVVALIA